MVHLYLALCDQFKWAKDEKKVDEMKEKNSKIVEGLKNKIEDAVENFGESEVREATLAEAEHYCRIVDKENAVNAYRETLSKTIGKGEKLDIVFSLIRLGFFWRDSPLILRNIEQAKDLLVTGGDWDRKNRLHAYEGFFFQLFFFFLFFFWWGGREGGREVAGCILFLAFLVLKGRFGWVFFF